MDLYYKSEGTGIPIAFIHGFSLDSTMWRSQVEHFSKTNRVITYDMRGYGKSPLPSGPYSHSEDLQSLLISLRISKAHIVGLSLGGEVAIDYALSYPDSVLSLTLADSSLSGYPSTVDWRVYGKEKGLEQAKLNWLNHEVFATSNRNLKVREQLVAMVRDYSGWHWLNTDPRIKLIPPANLRLSKIKVPTQIIVGKLDLPYYHDIGKILNEKISNSKLEILKDVGHMTNLENDVKFNQVVESFIKSTT